VTGFLALLGLTRAGFTAPSFAIFTDLIAGWVCAPGRATITAMIAVADPAGRRAHDAYHRFVRDGAWSMNRLWQALAVHLIARFYPTGPVELACDDRLFHHEGSKVEGAGTFRDAVRSTLRKVVYARGAEPGRDHPAGPPALGRVPGRGPGQRRSPQEARRHHHHRPRRDDDHRDRRLACPTGASTWSPTARTPPWPGPAPHKLTSRMRRDAALYQPAPPRTGRRGRPRTKGERLPTPTELSEAVSDKDWTTALADVRAPTGPGWSMSVTCSGTG